MDRIDEIRAIHDRERELLDALENHYGCEYYEMGSNLSVDAQLDYEREYQDITRWRRTRCLEINTRHYNAKVNAACQRN